jgi:predicted AlkP superfamily pyrophosphatase or phosphodiesterase
LPKRVLIVAVVASLAALGAVWVLQPPHGVPKGAPTEAEMADAIGAPVMQHIFNGHVEGRSGDIYLVPKPYSFMLGQWDLRTLGTNQPTLSTTHSNPWDYLTRVPIVFYGPGYVPADETVERPVDISGLAPTYRNLMAMTGFNPDGKPFDEIVHEAADVGPDTRYRAPKVIFTLIIDGGGWNALQMHPDSTPNLQALRKEGTTYANATIGSAPSITGALHSTFGTGDYPRDHGIPGNQMRDPEGEVVDTWLDSEDPRYLKVPTVSDLWDRDNGNKPVVAAVAYEGWHLGMLGHGSFLEGGDKDIAVVWDVEDESWSTNPDYYTLPDYLQTTDLPRLESYEQGLDPRDGLTDGTWFGHTVDYLQDPLKRPGTPAFVRFTGDATAAVFKKEPFGKDGVTDLMWVELKSPDYAGHAWNVTRPEQADVLRETDAQIGRFKRLLDKKVGPGNYVLAISADHGQQPLPDLFGGWRINNVELQKDIDRRFGDGLVLKVTPVDIYFNLDKVRDDDVSLDDIARFIGSYTLADNIPDGIPGADRVPESRLDETLFAGAFSGRYIESLDPDEIEGFGDSTYPEGSFIRRPSPSPSP